jgi:hypothetical protein
MGSALVVEDVEEEEALEEENHREENHREDTPIPETPEIDKLDAFIGRLGAETPPPSGSEHPK